jgi:hypothetical protein
MLRVDVRRSDTTSGENKEEAWDDRNAPVRAAFRGDAGTMR